MPMDGGSSSGRTRNIELDVEETKWIFVGGKGGVGKSTVSSTLAYSLAKKYSDESILLISTDPAHNLSDIYNQPFSGKPKPVTSLKNLFVMEIDPTSQHDLASDFNSNYKESTINSLISSINHMTNADGIASSSGESEDADDSTSDEKEDILSYIPGIDEAIAVVKVLEFAQSSEYKYLVFDTAPTGHTLRLLHLPLMLNRLVRKFLRWASATQGGNMIQQLGSLISQDMGNKFQKLIDELKVTQSKLDILVDLLKDKSQSQFVCVIIPEHLSVYENERLMQKLDKDGVTHVRNIVINRVDSQLSEAKDSKRFQKQCENVALIEELYCMDDADYQCKTHYIPIVPYEIRGVDKIASFSEYLSTNQYSNDIRSNFTMPDN